MTVRHKKSGGEYTVLGVARVEATLEPVVIYESNARPGEVWTRPHPEFCDGRFEII